MIRFVAYICWLSGGLILLIAALQQPVSRQADLVGVSYFAPGGQPWGIFQNINGYQRQLKAPPVSPNSFMAWSPDGQWVVYVCRTADTDQLCLTAYNSARTHLLMDNIFYARPTALWSPDSRYFAVKGAYNVVGHSLINVYQLEQPDRIPPRIAAITVQDRDATIAWSQDSRTLLYSDVADIYALDVRQPETPATLIYTHSQPVIVYEHSPAGLLFAEQKRPHGSTLYRLRLPDHTLETLFSDELGVVSTAQTLDTGLLFTVYEQNGLVTPYRLVEPPPYYLAMPYVTRVEFHPTYGLLLQLAEESLIAYRSLDGRGYTLLPAQPLYTYEARWTTMRPMPLHQARLWGMGLGLIGVGSAMFACQSYMLRNQQQKVIVKRLPHP